MKKIIIVNTTFSNKEDATDFAEKVVSERLAACAQLIGPVSSFYWWDGKIENTPEYQLSMKTMESHYEALEAYIFEHHPYDVPEIVATPVERSSREYATWVEDETS